VFLTSQIQCQKYRPCGFSTDDPQRAVAGTYETAISACDVVSEICKGVTDAIVGDERQMIAIRAKFAIWAMDAMSFIPKAVSHDYRIKTSVSRVDDCAYVQVRWHCRAAKALSQRH